MGDWRCKRERTAEFERRMERELFGGELRNLCCLNGNIDPFDCEGKYVPDPRRRWKYQKKEE